MGLLRLKDWAYKLLDQYNKYNSYGMWARPVQTFLGPGARGKKKPLKDTYIKIIYNLIIMKHNIFSLIIVSLTNDHKLLKFPA